MFYNEATFLTCENCFEDCFCQFFSYHPSNIYTMKVYVAWEHSSFKNVDLVAIQSFDPQARIFNWPIFGKVWYFPTKSSEGYKKLNPNDKTLILFVNDHKWVPSICQGFFSWSKNLKSMSEFFRSWINFWNGQQILSFAARDLSFWMVGPVIYKN